MGKEGETGYSPAWMTTRPPVSTSMLRMWRSSNRHTQEGGGVCDVGLYVYRLAVPEHGNVVDIECCLAAVGKGRTAGASYVQSQLAVTNTGVTVRNPVKPVSITASKSLVCPDGPCTASRTMGS